jgi:hypothetical protein
MATSDRITILGLTGDVDPVEHGGGVIFRNRHGVQFEFWDAAGRHEVVSVSRVPVPDDVLAEYSWIDLPGVARYTGRSVQALRRDGTSRDVLVRALLIRDLASYGTLIEEPDRLTKAALGKRWNRKIDAFYRKHPRHNPPVPCARHADSFNRYLGARVAFGSPKAARRGRYRITACHTDRFGTDTTWAATNTDTGRPARLKKRAVRDLHLRHPERVRLAPHHVRKTGRTRRSRKAR